MSYFLHRIQRTNASYTKGIEVHETLDDAIRSYWGRKKTAYNNSQFPDTIFVSCKITDNNGNVVAPYSFTWLKFQDQENKFFLHHIRINGETVSKDIDIHDNLDDAMIAFATEMEYGYNNPRFTDVSLVSCEITDILSGGLVLEGATWVKPEVEQEPEPDDTEE